MKEVPIKSPLEKNIFRKGPNWRQRNSWLLRGTSPPSALIEDDLFRNTKTEYSWQKAIPEKKGGPFVRFKTFKFDDTSEKLEDGAEIAIPAGMMTPVQCVVSFTEFSEVPFRGKLVFLYIDHEGKLAKYYFNVSEKRDSDFMLRVHRSAVMCWYACKDNKQDALVLEHEIPGFSLAQPPTVPDGATTFQGVKIPREFWQTVVALRNGLEENVIPECVYVA